MRELCPACAAISNGINRLPIFLVARRSRAPIAVDTGYHPDYVAPDGLKQKVSRAAGIARAAWRQSRRIKSVIVTHFHQDHFTGMDYCPTAEFVMQRAELKFWTGRSCVMICLPSRFAQEMRPTLISLPPEVASNHRRRCGALSWIGVAQGRRPYARIADGGARAGSGKAVLCGDIAYTFKDIRDHVPVGW